MLARGAAAEIVAGDQDLRAGRMRLPLYMYSESLDVGVAQDMARLPMEMYSIIPSNEYNGVSIGHTRATSLLPDGELAIEAYGGRIGTTARSPDAAAPRSPITGVRGDAPGASIRPPSAPLWIARVGRTPDSAAVPGRSCIRPVTGRSCIRPVTGRSASCGSLFAVTGRAIGSGADAPRCGACSLFAVTGRAFTERSEGGRAVARIT